MAREIPRALADASFFEVEAFHRGVIAFRIKKKVRL